MLFNLAYKSLLNRRASVLLSAFAIAISVLLVLGVQRLAKSAEESFQSAASGIDLIVGARGSQSQLLLNTIFGIGNPTNNISWQSYQRFRDKRDVAWTLPIALGDSYRGFRVIGSDKAFFKHFRYQRKQPLKFAQGRGFENAREAVLGAQVAEKLKHRLNDPIALSHGTSEKAVITHVEHPFRVAGILRPTGTPLDRAVLVSLGGIEGIHAGWQSGAPPAPEDRKALSALDHTGQHPDSISAFFVGLKSKLGIFKLQRDINAYADEPLSALLPLVTLAEIWRLIGNVETALTVLSGFVAFSALLGLLTVILSGLNERRREMAILRAVGATPALIFILLLLESMLLTILGAAIGTGLLFLASTLLAPLAQQHGIVLTQSGLSSMEWLWLLAIIAGAALLSLIPAAMAYRQSLADGLNIRV